MGACFAVKTALLINIRMNQWPSECCDNALIMGHKCFFPSAWLFHRPDRVRRHTTEILPLNKVGNIQLVTGGTFVFVVGILLCAAYTLKWFSHSWDEATDSPTGGHLEMLSVRSSPSGDQFSPLGRSDCPNYEDRRKLGQKDIWWGLCSNI